MVNIGHTLIYHQFAYPSICLLHKSCELLVKRAAQKSSLNQLSVWHDICITIMRVSKVFVHIDCLIIWSVQEMLHKWLVLNNQKKNWAAGIRHKNFHGSTYRKRVQPAKNSDPVNKIVKRKTSHCLIGTCFLRNVLEKHQSKMLRTATFIFCPG